MDDDTDHDFLERQDGRRAMYFIPWAVCYLWDLDKKLRQNLSVLELVQAYDDHLNEEKQSP